MRILSDLDFTYLSSENHRQLWIPKGFAHGFLVLSQRADFLYKTTDYSHANSEEALAWSDTDIGIKWPADDLEILLSEKDKAGKPLKAMVPVN